MKVWLVASIPLTMSSSPPRTWIVSPIRFWGLNKSGCASSFIMANMIPAWLPNRSTRKWHISALFHILCPPMSPTWRPGSSYPKRISSLLSQNPLGLITELYVNDLEAYYHSLSTSFSQLAPSQMSISSGQRSRLNDYIWKTT